MTLILPPSIDDDLLPMIRTCGINAIPGEISRHRPDLIISICGDTRDRARADGYLADSDVPVLRMSFDDVERVQSNMIAPSIDAFETLFADIDQLFPVQPVGNLLVHCSMGVSRSSATALVAAGYIAKGFYTDLDEATWARDLVSQFFERQPFSAPNQRVLAIGERLLGTLGRHIRKEVQSEMGRPCENGGILPCP